MSSVIITEALIFCDSDPDHAVATIVRRGGDSYDVHPCVGDVKQLGEAALFDGQGKAFGGNFVSYKDAVDAATAFADPLDTDASALKDVKAAGDVADLQAEIQTLRKRIIELGG